MKAILGGYQNAASGNLASVVGGHRNTASGGVGPRTDASFAPTLQKRPATPPLLRNTQHNQSVIAPLLPLTVAAVFRAGSVATESDDQRVFVGALS